MTTKNPYLDPSSDIIQKVVKSYPNGLTASGLACVIRLESSGNPNAVSPGGGYIGLGQVGVAEFKAYGPPKGDRKNPCDNLMATANLAQNNARLLKHALGRNPTDAEIYLAHQQGVTGSLKLIEHPHNRSGDLVGDARIRGNGGDPNNSASVFINMWTKRFHKGEVLNG